MLRPLSAGLIFGAVLFAQVALQARSKPFYNSIGCFNCQQFEAGGAGPKDRPIKEGQYVLSGTVKGLNPLAQNVAQIIQAGKFIPRRGQPDIYAEQRTITPMFDQAFASLFPTGGIASNFQYTGYEGPDQEFMDSRMIADRMTVPSWSPGQFQVPDFSETIVPEMISAQVIPGVGIRYYQPDEYSVRRPVMTRDQMGNALLSNRWFREDTKGRLPHMIDWQKQVMSGR